MIDIQAARHLWHPIASSNDLPFRHVFHAQLLGRELAVWRADDGTVNVWENRCLHRGVRLSIGINDGTELICQYHGWRYANRTAGCTYIPAHPADAPARTICNNIYPVHELNGLIWSSDTPQGSPPNLADLDSAVTTPLKSVTINAPVEDVSLALSDAMATAGVQSDRYANTHYELIENSTYRLVFRALSDTDSIIATHDNDPEASAETNVENHSEHAVDVVFFLQPQDATRTVVRGLSCRKDNHEFTPSQLTELLRHFNQRLNRIRSTVEQAQQHRAPCKPWIPVIPRVSESDAQMPALSTSGRSAALRMKVVSVTTLARHIKQFELEPVGTPLPTAQAGAHIDVHLPNGLIRQYSLINGPGQTGNFCIAVKKLANSTGGSSSMHSHIKPGDVLATSVPRNNFTLRRDAEHTLLMAGGIGITPLLSMARTLHHTGLPFTLHYFVADESDIVFHDELQSWSGAVHFHIALNADATGKTLNQILSSPDAHQHVYLCGPGPMLTAARKIAQQRHWPDKSIHFEYFKNTRPIDDKSAFSVELARSGLTLNVPPGQTLLQVLRANHVAMPSSCEQGACGTCKVAVLDGTPDHQDVYLSDAEKQKNDCLMSCVSRAISDTLVLDL